MTLEPSSNNELGVDLRMTNDLIHFFRAGVHMDLLNHSRTIIYNRISRGSSLE